LKPQEPLEKDTLEDPQGNQITIINKNIDYIQELLSMDSEED
jgi:hypothetical protein